MQQGERRHFPVLSKLVIGDWINMWSFTCHCSQGPLSTSHEDMNLVPWTLLSSLPWGCCANYCTSSHAIKSQDQECGWSMLYHTSWFDICDQESGWFMLYHNLALVGLESRWSMLYHNLPLVGLESGWFMLYHNMTLVGLESGWFMLYHNLTLVGLESEWSMSYHNLALVGLESGWSMLYLQFGISRSRVWMIYVVSYIMIWHQWD